MSELKGLAKAFNTIITRAEEPAAAPLTAEEQRKKVEIKLRRQIRELRKSRKLDDGHKPVNVLQKDLEKQLRRVATKGVVALFNAVRSLKEANTETSAQSTKDMPIDSFMDLLKSK